MKFKKEFLLEVVEDGDDSPYFVDIPEYTKDKNKDCYRGRMIFTYNDKLYSVYYDDYYYNYDIDYNDNSTLPKPFSDCEDEIECIEVKQIRKKVEVITYQVETTYKEL